MPCRLSTIAHVPRRSLEGENGGEIDVERFEDGSKTRWVSAAMTKLRKEAKRW